MTQRATVADVARLAGVSAKTVSRVFNEPDVVNRATRERVREAAKRLRFRPNSLARGLRSGGRTGTVGLIVGELGNPFYYKVAQGLEHELSQHGFQLLLASTDDTAAGERRAAEALMEQRVEALVMIPVTEDQSHLQEERAFGTPVITVDRPAGRLLADAIVLENREGVIEAVRALLAAGHRRIGYVCQPADVYTQRLRIAAYREALGEAGVRDTAEWEAFSDERATDPQELVAGLLESPTPPTAILCGNNRATIGALRALAERGDQSTALIGFDDFDTADVLGVSVISYDPVEMGRVAARVTMQRIKDPLAFPQQHFLPTWMVRRGSGERKPSAIA